MDASGQFPEGIQGYVALVVGEIFLDQITQALRFFPGSVQMVIHPPISPEGKAVDELVGQTRQAIASAMPPEMR